MTELLFSGWSVPLNSKFLLFSYFPLSFLCIEIVDRVALCEWPYLRPSVNPQAHSEELGQLMQRCWAEEPSDRPEFNHISVLLRKQNRSVPFCALVLAVLLTCLKSFNKHFYTSYSSLITGARKASSLLVPPCYNVFVENVHSPYSVSLSVSHPLSQGAQK